MNFITSESGNYIKDFDTASRTLINAFVAKGRKNITLCEIYETLGASNMVEKTSVRWGVRHMKDANIICKTQTRGVYGVK
jgi:hypothetical protein